MITRWLPLGKFNPEQMEKCFLYDFYSENYNLGWYSFDHDDENFNLDDKEKREKIWVYLINIKDYKPTHFYPCLPPASFIKEHYTDIEKIGL